MLYMMPFDRRSSNLFDAIDRMMSENYSGSDEKFSAPCRTDILDEGEKFVLKADMPGFRKENIKIGVRDGELTVSAERTDTPDEAESRKYIHRERRYDSLSRSFGIEGIEVGAITASYENGVLTLDLPKVKEVKPETHNISIT